MTTKVKESSHLQSDGASDTMKGLQRPSKKEVSILEKRPRAPICLTAKLTKASDGVS